MNELVDKSVLLIGNYSVDKQFSMLQYQSMLSTGLRNQEVEVDCISPEPKFGAIIKQNKWVGYVDKLLLFPIKLRMEMVKRHSLDASPHIVHVCDHSNSLYLRYLKEVLTVTTCHDLIAIRMAGGEFIGENVSNTGLVLQRIIKTNLKFSTAFVCDSESTKSDLERIIPSSIGKTNVVYPGLYAKFREIPDLYIKQKLEKYGLCNEDLFVLHVGNSAWYKNRRGVVEVFAEYVTHYDDDELKLVLVGDELSDENQRFLSDTGLEQRVVTVGAVQHEELCALYSCAQLLLFPSRYEGFGWPPVEAQACGCPVVCSYEGSLKEVVRDSALTAPWNDVSGHVQNLRKVLVDPRVREDLIQKGHKNISRFTTDNMINGICEIYKTVISSN